MVLFSPGDNVLRERIVLTWFGFWVSTLTCRVRIPAARLGVVGFLSSHHTEHGCRVLVTFDLITGS